jgi:hypothetical protein
VNQSKRKKLPLWPKPLVVNGFRIAYCNEFNDAVLYPHPGANEVGPLIRWLTRWKAAYEARRDAK